MKVTLPKSKQKLLITAIDGDNKATTWYFEVDEWTLDMTRDVLPEEPDPLGWEQWKPGDIHIKLEATSKRP